MNAEGAAGRGWLRRFVARMRDELRVLWLVGRDPEVPLAARVLVVLVVAYALSPIDLIPDFVPVLGLLDDAILVPLGIWLAMRLVPEQAWARARARVHSTPARLPRSRLGASLILITWAAAIAALTLALA